MACERRRHGVQKTRWRRDRIGQLIGINVVNLLRPVNQRWVVSGLPGAKVRRGTKHSSDPSPMYNITTIGLPTTIPVL